jgi:choline dehydrogenase-like flavoprotein
MWRGPLQAARLLVEPDMGDPAARFVVEAAPGHPGLVALALPWEGTDAHAGVMDRARFLAPLIAICRDRDGGRVSLSRSGHVRLHYRVSPRDAATMRKALLAMADVARAAGALELIALGTPALRHRRDDGPADDDGPSFARFREQLARWDPSPGRGLVFSAHQMGTARMGADPVAHPVDPDGRVRSRARPEEGTVRGLYVADASLFPTAAGVNPMMTVMALARRVARTVLADA